MEKKGYQPYFWREIRSILEVFFLLTNRSFSVQLAYMKLRDHPLMTRKSGINLWPPPWSTASLDKQNWPHGEIGTLKRVWMHPRLGTCIFLFVNYEGISYTGSMYFDDPRFCIDIYHVFEMNVGRSIREIGDIDISHTL